MRLVDENMLGALRLVTVQRGMPADTFALVPFGGAGAAARERAGGDPRLLPGDRAAGARASSRPSGSSSPTCAASSAGRSSARSPTCEPGEVRRAPRGARRGGRRVPGPPRASRRPTARSATSPTCATTARATSSPIDGDLRGGDARRARRRASRATHERLYGFGLPGGAELVTLRAAASGAAAIESRARATARPPARVGRPDRHRTRSGTARRTATSRPTTAPGSRRAWSSTARRWSSSTTPPRSSCEGHVATVDRTPTCSDQPTRSAA